ncbi:restriction endonuclease subunit S [Mycoplasmopsis felis]|uniref:restriction endonuclease subunit S n=1 Tax=Mycoplasmopsis felis TaxID=33923 RepID=UPI002AF6B23C|nr:restriction endonuclease subunit S [Mycoplasmopsis felis]WQQ01620.1 restriction endonuclease subunit S [Mycoplasmopsis felis]
MKKVLFPRVRFKEFSEEWNTKTLGDICSSFGGTSLERFFNSYGNYKVISIGNFGISGVYEDQKLRINLNDITQKYLLDKDDLAMILNDKTQECNILGKCIYIDKNNEYIYNQRTQRLKVNKNLVFSKYLFYLINFSKFREKVKVEAQGNTQVYLNFRNVANFTVDFPLLSEQQKIGKLLDEISNLINLENSKLNKLKQLKETLLQKMFPEGNSKTPRIRFEGFEGEWKEERLEEIGQTYTGLSGKTKKDFGHGNSRYITYLNIFNNPIANLKGLDRIEEDCKQNSVKYGDIFVTTSSEIPEEVGITSIWPFKDKENIYLNSFCFGIRLNNINNYYINFLAYNLRNNELRKDIVLLAQGISRFNISNRRFMKLYILLPNISEQQKIGDFFSKIDSLLSLYQSKLNKLKQIKEALLQKMFV